jgi:hypothetical protein
MKDNGKKQLSTSTVLIIWATKYFVALIYSRIRDCHTLHKPQFGTSRDVKLFYIGPCCLDMDFVHLKHIWNTYK